MGESSQEFFQGTTVSVGAAFEHLKVGGSLSQFASREGIDPSSIVRLLQDRWAAVLAQGPEMSGAFTVSDRVMHGEPVFRGTRVPVQTLFDHLECNETLQDFLEGFPTVGKQAVVLILDECRMIGLVAAN